MHDALLVGLVQSAGDLLRDFHDRSVVFQLPLGNQPPQRLPIDKSHRDKVNAADITDVVNRTDVGAADLGGRTRLAEEALNDLRVVADERRFQRHVALQLRVVREIDGTHRTPAEQAHDLVRAETFAGREDRHLAPDGLGPRRW